MHQEKGAGIRLKLSVHCCKLQLIRKAKTTRAKSDVIYPTGSRVSSVGSGWRVHNPHDVPSSQLAAFDRDHNLGMKSLSEI